MSQIVLDAPASEFRHGWPVVVACFCTAVFAWGFGFYGQSVYLAELHHTRGWPASLIASATTVYYLAGALLLTRVHRAIALLGPRLLLAWGAAVLGLGAIGLSRAQAPWQLYVCGIVMATGWAATTTTAIAMTLAYWFDRRRGLALSLALAAQVGFIVHQVAFLLPPLGRDGAGVAIAATAIAAAIGRLALAPLIDRVDQRVASAASFASQAAGLGLMLAMPDRPEALYVGSVVFGLSVGNVITLPALIVQREFPAQLFGAAIGWSSMIGQATLAFGPTLLGLARDATGSYAAAIALCVRCSSWRRVSC